MPSASRTLTCPWTVPLAFWIIFPGMSQVRGTKTCHEECRWNVLQHVGRPHIAHAILFLRDAHYTHGQRYTKAASLIQNTFAVSLTNARQGPCNLIPQSSTWTPSSNFPTIRPFTVHVRKMKNYDVTHQGVECVVRANKLHQPAEELRRLFSSDSEKESETEIRPTCCREGKLLARNK